MLHRENCIYIQSLATTYNILRYFAFISILKGKRFEKVTTP